MTCYSGSDVQKIVAAFARLGIKPTVDGAAVKRAFRAAASQEHPDCFQSEADKRRAHVRFIELAEARDVAMTFSAHGVLTDILQSQPAATASNAYRREAASGEPVWEQASNADHTDGWDQGDDFWPKQSDTAYEEEWRVFVADENAYFRFWDSTSATLAVLVQSVSVSLFVSFLFGVIAFLGIPLIIVAIVLFVAFASASVAIPIVGWIVGLVVLGMLASAVGGLWEQLQTGIDSAALRMLQTVARTGYPSRAFAFSCAVSLSCAAALAIYLWSLTGTMGSLDLLFGLWRPDAAGLIAINASALFITMAVSLAVVWNRVGHHMASLDEAFAKIRNSASYGLVLASKSG